jgi:hypothetical protein
MNERASKTRSRDRREPERAALLRPQRSAPESLHLVWSDDEVGDTNFKNTTTSLSTNPASFLSVVLVVSGFHPASGDRVANFDLNCKGGVVRELCGVD